MQRHFLQSIAALLLVIMLVAAVACSRDDEGAAGDGQTAAGDGQTAIDSGQAAAGGVLLFGIGMHIEPMGAVPSSLVGEFAESSGNRSTGDYNNPGFFERHVQDINAVASIVESHQGRLTVQAQTPFTSVAASSGETILADLAARGHEIGLHFHEDAHLGKNPEKLSSETWCAVMKEEIGFLERAASGADIRYWSGGNLYPELLDAASCAGLDVNSDWKNPHEQSTASELIGVNPWRPSGSSNGSDVTGFAHHDPAGPVIYLPEGIYERNNFASSRRAAGGDQAYFDFLKDSLIKSLEQAEADPSRVSVFHFTIHPGEFRGDAAHPFAVIDRFLTEVVDPLVASGRIRWSTFSEMADAYANWEQANPGVSPRAAS